MGLLDGKTLLITGVLTPDSIAYSVAERCLSEGALIALTGFGRAMNLTKKTAARLSDRIPVYELDITNPDHGELLTGAIKDEFGVLDGALHSIGFMPKAGLSEDLLEATWEDVGPGFQISAFSLQQLAKIVVPLMSDGGDIVTLDFDNSHRSWGPYGHMGPAKAALQAYVRYLASQFGVKGIRVNAVAAGPLKTMAARSIPGFSEFEAVWNERAPLGWDVNDAGPVADACAMLFTGRFSKTTGAVFPVDGGFSIVGA